MDTWALSHKWYAQHTSFLICNFFVSSGFHSVFCRLQEAHAFTCACYHQFRKVFFYLNCMCICDIPTLMHACNACAHTYIYIHMHKEDTYKVTSRYESLKFFLFFFFYIDKNLHWKFHHFSIHCQSIWHEFWLGVETIAPYCFAFYITFPPPTVNWFQRTVVATIFCNATSFDCTYYSWIHRYRQLRLWISELIISWLKCVYINKDTLMLPWLDS